MTARCKTCARWTPRLVHVPPHWDVATRPTWGECGRGDEPEMTTEYDRCAAWAGRGTTTAPKGAEQEET